MKRGVASLFTVLVVASCAVPTDDSPQVIAQADLAPSLQQSTTTTSSTTVPTEARDFAYYLLAELPDSDRRVVRQVVAPVRYNTLFEAIEPMEGDGFAATITDEELVNRVSRYDVEAVDIDGGVATVFLRTLTDVPDNPTLRDVAAQLVWTLTSSGDDVRAIRITIDGEPTQIPTTNDEDSLVVTIDDFALYNEEIENAETTTTSAPATSSTTIPPDDE